MFALMLMLACTSPGEPYAVPEGATQLWYAPLEAATTFPDDFHTRAEPASRTGRAVDLKGGHHDALDRAIPDEFNVLEVLSRLDGFGTTAGVVFQFSEGIDEDSVTPQFVRLEDGAEVGAEWAWHDIANDFGEPGRMLVITPLVPLDPMTSYGVVVADAIDDAGERVYASEDLYGLVAGTKLDPRFAWLLPSYQQLLTHTSVQADQIAAATVFTTQSLFDEEDAVKDLLPTVKPKLTIQPGCTAQTEVVECAATLDAADFLGPDGVLDLDWQEAPEVQRRYTLPVRILLPANGTPPYDVVIYGHGLGGDRFEGRVGRVLADLNIATVSIDAPMHHEHPLADGSPDLFWIVQFFGISATDGSWDVYKLRDNWRAAAWDKAQLAMALREGGHDFDDDGTDDVTTRSKLGYSGHSLGAIMGVELMYVDDDLLAADLSVPGARVSDIVREGQDFAPLVKLMTPPGVSEGQVTYFFPYLQAAVERGEPANFAPHVLDGRRDVLVHQVIDDTIMPNSTTRFLARSLGIEHAPPFLQDVEGLKRTGKLPLSGNLDGRTAVLYQYDQQLDDNDELQPADHGHSHTNGLGAHQIHRFWESWLEDDLAEVVDPLDDLGL